MSLIPKKLENIATGLFDSAKALISSVEVLHLDIADFKTAIRGLREDLQDFRESFKDIKTALEKNTTVIKDLTKELKKKK